MTWFQQALEHAGFDGRPGEDPAEDDPTEIRKYRRGPWCFALATHHDTEIHALSETIANAIVIYVDGSVVLGLPGPHSSTMRAVTATANPVMAQRTICGGLTILVPAFEAAVASRSGRARRR